MSSTSRAVVFALVMLPAAASRAAPPPIAPVAEPPARVGRVAAVTGAVSFHTRDQTAWSPALTNLPVTSGDAVWTEPGARAALDIAGNRIWLDSRTLLELPVLDDHAVSATETQGALYLHLRSIPPGDVYSIQTPRGLVQLVATGRYAVSAGDDNEPTRVTVLDGAAQVSAPGLTLDVGPNVTATLSGAGTEADPVHGVLGPAQRDTFVIAMLALERPAISHPAVSRMTGSEDLDRYGTWRDRPKYGAVWYPPVEPGWVPYRQGRWSWVTPWGWTWVDEAPWGFAPFHYGRWIEDDGRWGWTPAPAPEYVLQPIIIIEPVYAPALVSFVAFAAVGVGIGERPVGWVPLGPNEPYYPPYRARLPYIQNLNIGTVQNARTIINDNSVHTNIYNRITVQNFVNRDAATVAPASAVIASRPIAAAALPQAVVTPALTRAQAGYQPGFAPTAATLGVTPVVARQFHFATVAALASPGPAIAPRALPAVQGPIGQPVPNGNRAAAVPAVVLPGVPAGAPVPASDRRAPPVAVLPTAPVSGGVSAAVSPTVPVTIPAQIAGRPSLDRAGPASGLPQSPVQRRPDPPPAAGRAAVSGDARPSGPAPVVTATGTGPERNSPARTAQPSPEPPRSVTAARPEPRPANAGLVLGAPPTGVTAAPTLIAPLPRPERPAVQVPRPEPQRPEPPRPQPQRFEPPRPEPARVQPPRPEPARPEPPRPEPSRPEQPRPQPQRFEPTRPEPVRVQPPRPEISRPEPPRAQPPRPEQPRMEPQRQQPPRPPPSAPAPQRPAPAQPPPPRPIPQNSGAPHPTPAGEARRPQ